MANIYPTTVASKTLVAGNRFAGFFGEVPVSELWSGEQLASLLGVTQGTAQFSNEPYLKWFVDGKVILKSKKPIRHSISWNHLNEKGVVYENKIIEDKYGNQYKVRLMKGALTNPSKNGDRDRGAKGSEWNKLMLPIHERAKNKNWAYPANVESEIPSDWGIEYTDKDLVTNFGGDNGRYQWCQERLASSSTSRVYRGSIGVSSSLHTVASNTGSGFGWSPVLELIPKDITFIKDNNTLHTKEGEKPFTKENLTEENGYYTSELDRKLTTFDQRLESESFYKKSTINLKKYFDIHSLGVNSMYIEKKIDFNMTSNTTPAPYVVSASGSYSTNYSEYNAFSGPLKDASYCWLADSAKPAWIKIDFNKEKTISKIVIVARKTGDSRDIIGPPKKIKIELGQEVMIYEIDNKMKSSEKFEIKLKKSIKSSDLKVNILEFYERKVAPNNPAIGEIEVYELVEE